MQKSIPQNTTTFDLQQKIIVHEMLLKSAGKWIKKLEERIEILESEVRKKRERARHP
jgi:hypothetical protein